MMGSTIFDGALVAHAAMFVVSCWMWGQQVHAMKSAWAQRVGVILSIRACSESAAGYDGARRAFYGHQPVLAATELGWWSSIGCCFGTFAMLLCAYFQMRGVGVVVGDAYSWFVVMAFTAAVLWAHALRRRSLADRAYIMLLRTIRTVKKKRLTWNATRTRMIR